MSLAPILILIASLAGLTVLIWLLSGWFDDHYVSQEQPPLEPD